MKSLQTDRQTDRRTDRRTDGQTDDGRQVIRKAHLSFQLRWAKNVFIKLFKSRDRWYYIYTYLFLPPLLTNKFRTVLSLKFSSPKMVLQKFHNHVCFSIFSIYISLLFIEEKQIEFRRKYKRCPDTCMCTLQSIWGAKRWSKNRPAISNDHVTINEPSIRKTWQWQIMEWSILFTPVHVVAYGIM